MFQLPLEPSENAKPYPVVAIHMQLAHVTGMNVSGPGVYRQKTTRGTRLATSPNCQVSLRFHTSSKDFLHRFTKFFSQFSTVLTLIQERLIGRYSALTINLILKGDKVRFSIQQVYARQTDQGRQFRLLVELCVKIHHPLWRSPGPWMF